MPWKPGESGNPRGGAAAPKPFLDAIKRAIAQTDGQALRDCAEVLIAKAKDGESWAMQMLADRLDGKPQQEVTIKREAREMTLDEILGELAANRAAGGTAGAQTSAAELSQVH